jgi:hypothetical protein
LDFAKLVDEHGPVDTVEAKTPGSGDGEAPFKICPHDRRIRTASMVAARNCGKRQALPGLRL